jgi:hypothetical protein
MSGSVAVYPTGNGRVQVSYLFRPPRAYDRVRRFYPNLYVLFRDFSINRANFEVQRNSITITPDDSSRSIAFKADVYGMAVCRNEKWELEISPNERFITRTGNRIYTTLVWKSENNYLISGKFEYILPANATILEFAPDRKKLTYTLPHRKIAGKPKTDIQLRAKPRLMAGTYKIYADPEASDGAYWAAKTVFKNTGDVPIYDLRITYKMGEYTEESVAQKYSMVPAKGAVVDAYYPVISSRVAQLRSRTPIELRMRYEYRDASGKVYSDQLAERVELLGVNQFEFSNLSDFDRTDSWFDDFNNARLLAAFVTKNDDAVRQFAGIVSDASGGVAASSSDQEAQKWLRAAYEQQLKNNIVYQTPSGFLTTAKSSGQEIKYPRDVFRDKAGTCVDLAITYAALAEAVGLRAHLLLMPGHCFTLIQLPGGNMLPVENTGLSGGETRMSFEQAIQAGARNLKKAREEGLLYLVEVSRELGEGRISNPELPPLGTDFLEKLGIRRRR